MTTGIVDRLSDGSFMLKPLKQKQYIDGLVFLLQEIYGIENKLVDNKVRYVARASCMLLFCYFCLLSSV